MTIDTIFQAKEKLAVNTARQDLKSATKNDFSKIFNRQVKEQRGQGVKAAQANQGNQASPLSNQNHLNATKSSAGEKPNTVKQETQGNKVADIQKIDKEDVAAVNNEPQAIEEDLIPYEALAEEIIALLNQLSTIALNDEAKAVVTEAVAQISDELLSSQAILATLTNLLSRLEKEAKLQLSSEDREIFTDKLAAFMKEMKQTKEPLETKAEAVEILAAEAELLQTSIKPQHITAVISKAEESNDDLQFDSTLNVAAEAPVMEPHQLKDKENKSELKLEETTEAATKESNQMPESLGLNTEKAEVITKFVNTMQQEIQKNHPQNLLNQIVNKVEILVHNNKNEIKMHLSPEALGNLTIKISVEEGTLTAKVFTENYQIKELLESNLNQLRINLGEKGINVGSLEVNVGQQQESFQFQQSQLQQQKSKLKKLAAVGATAAANYIEDSVQSVNPYAINSNFEGLA